MATRTARSLSHSRRLFAGRVLRRPSAGRPARPADEYFSTKGNGSTSVGVIPMATRARPPGRRRRASALPPRKGSSPHVTARDRIRVRLSGKGLTVARFRRQRCEQASCPFGCQAVAGAIQCWWSLSRLWVAVISRHSECTAARPRRLNCLKPRLCLICPKVGSIDCARWL
jgi:hypothetical protein